MNVQKYKIRKQEKKKKHDIKKISEKKKKREKISVLITSNEQEFTVKKE